MDYLTRLEQGRASSPSAQVAEALARSLRLADTERDLLFRLAGLSAPGPGVVPGDDLRVMVYTAAPGTEDAERLELAIVLGTQALVD